VADVLKMKVAKRAQQKSDKATSGDSMNRGRFWQKQMLLLPLFALLSAVAPVCAQTAQSDSEQFQARIDAAALALRDQPRFKGLSTKYRRELAEFVAGNMLFVLLHEMGHAAMAQMRLPVLGRAEDAADSFAVLRLMKVGSEFTDRVLAEAARGWFLADLRDQKTGDTVSYYDEHGLNQQRAYQIVCLMVGSDKGKFRDIANETKLPGARRDRCANDYESASYSWELVLKPHVRASDQLKTQIDVVYGEPKPRHEAAARAFRFIRLLETVARYEAESFVWPNSFALEMQSCGVDNAHWDDAARRLTLCYDLAVDFSELYRIYGTRIRK